jgi:hypothetical protein
VNHLFGGNGSVPSIGGTTSLVAALAAVDRAEQALAAARALARSAAKREGRGARHLFSGGRFVSRASAERWCDEARSEGESEAMRFLTDTIFRGAASVSVRLEQ